MKLRLRRRGRVPYIQDTAPKDPAYAASGGCAAGLACRLRRAALPCPSTGSHLDPSRAAVARKPTRPGELIAGCPCRPPSGIPEMRLPAAEPHIDDTTAQKGWRAKCRYGSGTGFRHRFARGKCSWRRTARRNLGETLPASSAEDGRGRAGCSRRVRREYVSCQRTAQGSHPSTIWGPLLAQQRGDPAGR